MKKRYFFNFLMIIGGIFFSLGLINFATSRELVNIANPDHFLWVLQLVIGGLCLIYGIKKVGGKI